MSGREIARGVQGCTVEKQEIPHDAYVGGMSLDLRRK
jgi:hypothetical protein